MPLCHALGGLPKARTVIAPSIALLLAACQNPAVSFTPAPAARLDAQGNRTPSDPKLALAEAQSGATYFSIATNRLSFSPSSGWSDAPAKPSSTAPFKVAALPIDSDQGFYATPKSKLFQSRYFSTTTTALTIQYVDGTHVPSTVSATVTDNAQVVFQTLGTAVGDASHLFSLQSLNLLPQSGGAVAPLNAFFIDLPDTKQDLPTAPQPLPSNSGWKYQIWLDDPTASDVLKLADLQANLPNGSDPFVAYFPFVACRPAKIVVTSPAGNDYTLYAQVGTPEWVEAVSIPAGGKITAGANCGASTTPGNVDPTTPLKDIAAAISAASSIKGTTATTKAATPSPASNKK